MKGEHEGGSAARAKAMERWRVVLAHEKCRARGVIWLTGYRGCCWIANSENFSKLYLSTEFYKASLLQKSLLRWAKRINTGDFCNCLGANVMVNRTLTEMVLLSTSVNQKNILKKARQAIMGPPSPSINVFCEAVSLTDSVNKK